MNYLKHPNLLAQYWASVNTDFDKLLDKFVRAEGWLFQDLGLIAKKENIGAIYRSACTTQHGIAQEVEARLDHFTFVISVILDAAKTQWLAPWRDCVVDPSKGVIPPFLKRQAGGFFLLYMLYLSQPLPNRYRRRQRIMMDAKDIISMHAFNETMLRLPKADDHFKELGRQLVVIYNDMVQTEAFEFCVVSETMVTPCHSVRQLLANKQCDITKLIYPLKDIRDQLQYITHHESSKVFASLVAYGKFLPRKAAPQRSEKAKPIEKEKTSKKVWTLEDIKALENENDLGKLADGVVGALKSLDIGTVLNRRRVLGTDETILDKELNYITKGYLAWSQEQLRWRMNKCQEPRQDRRDDERSTTQIIRRYCNGDYDWVGDVFSPKNSVKSMENTNKEPNQDMGVRSSNQSRSQTDMDDVIKEFVGLDNVKTRKDNDIEDLGYENYIEEDLGDGDDWTGSECDLDELLTENSKDDGQDEEKSVNPAKRSRRFMSMPSFGCS